MRFWSVYLARRGFTGPVETLISWTLQNELEYIDDDRAYLAATTLTWFFTTSHREIRDKATKALARILSRRLLLATRLIGDFVRVNDLYVLERLLAACYGAALQGTAEAGLAELAQEVFDTIFYDKEPPQNALLRDHAQGIVEYAAWRGVLPALIDLKLVRPPYKSLWPIEPVPDTLIDCYTEGHRHRAFSDAIVGSTISDMADFATYVIDDKVKRWSPARMGTSPLPTNIEVCMSWMQDFLASATADQREMFDGYVISFKASSDVHNDQVIPDMEQLEVAEAAFQQTMTSDQWEDFRVRAKDVFRHDISLDQAAHFDVHWGRRWICKRAHELGWTSDRFGSFDNRRRSLDRDDHRIERIGKKYQWIALQELIARMGDNLASLDNDRQKDEDEPARDPIARQIGLRDVDPSLLTTKTHYDGWREWDRTWWVPFDPQFRPMVPHERLAWLESSSDIINDCALIDVQNPKTGRRWLALSGFSHWNGYGTRDGQKEFQRDTWFRITCIVVHCEDQAKMIESLRGKTLTSPSSFPRMEYDSGFSYLGECHWHPEIRGRDGWISQNNLQPFAVPIRPTVASYMCSRGGYDYSIDRTVSVEIPALWLSKCMGLRLSSGRSLIFVNSQGKETFYDPSVVESGPSTALVDRDTFLRMLGQQDLSAIWVIAGEKSVYGGG